MPTDVSILPLFSDINEEEQESIRRCQESVTSQTDIFQCDPDPTARIINRRYTGPIGPMEFFDTALTGLEMFLNEKKVVKELASNFFVQLNRGCKETDLLERTKNIGHLKNVILGFVVNLCKFPFDIDEFFDPCEGYSKKVEELGEDERQRFDDNTRGKISGYLKELLSYVEDAEKKLDELKRNLTEAVMSLNPGDADMEHYLHIERQHIREMPITSGKEKEHSQDEEKWEEMKTVCQNCIEEEKQIILEKKNELGRYTAMMRTDDPSATKA